MERSFLDGLRLFWNSKHVKMTKLSRGHPSTSTSGRGFGAMRSVKIDQDQQEIHCLMPCVDVFLFLGFILPQNYQKSTF